LEIGGFFVECGKEDGEAFTLGSDECEAFFAVHGGWD
jgi:hypothetical protein